ncbi:MAG: hypothetical protein U0168_13290 [Nannocystaceae bacterium]
MQRWIALCDGAVTPEDLSPALRGREPAVDPDDLRITRVDRLERELIAARSSRRAATRPARPSWACRASSCRRSCKLAEGAGGGGISARATRGERPLAAA